MTCNEEKNIDEFLQHLRECDKCYICIKNQIIDFAKTTKGRILITTIKAILPEFKKKDA